MPRSTSRTARRWAIAAVGVLLVAVVGASPAAGQDELGRLREERERVQAERAEAASQVDAQQAEVGELTAALEALQAQVSAAEVKVADAERRLAEARSRQAEAEQAVVDQQARIVRLEGQLASRAVESFIGQRGAEDVSLLDTADLYRTMRMRSLVDVVTRSEADVVEELSAAREDLEVEEAGARQARADAEAHQAAVEEELARLGEARDAHARLAEQADVRLDRLLSEAQALAALEGQLGQRIAEAEAEAARRLAEAQAAAAARARAAQRAQASSSRSSASGGSSAPAQMTSSGEIVSVRGIRVHRSIASQLEAMLAAAEADGHRFGGGGFRDPRDQIRLRRAHCGSSDFAVYQASPSACSPPTARPGTSNHERGLAIDFVHDGGVIVSRSNPGFRWLAANAASYGFYNLPSEPWHWSVDGR